MLLIYLTCLYFLSYNNCMKVEKVCNCSLIIYPPTSKSQALKVRNLDFIVDNHLPQELCDHSYFVKKVINPYNTIQTTQSDRKSICLQCAACLTIAQQIENAISNLSIGFSDPLQEMRALNVSLNHLCKMKLEKYELENREGYSIVFEKNHGCTRKESNHLEERCFRYLNTMNIANFYNNLLNNNKVKDLLCRSDNIFRDCGNINYHELSTTELWKDKKIILKIECIL